MNSVSDQTWVGGCGGGGGGLDLNNIWSQEVLIRIKGVLFGAGGSQQGRLLLTSQALDSTRRCGLGHQGVPATLLFLPFGLQ